MRKNAKQYLLWVLVAALFSWGIYAAVQYQSSPGELDGFASCLKEKGAIFYGAFWCPHCQNQKKMFGKSADMLAYVECSTPDGRGQYPVCVEKEIKGYPTWVFADGSRLSGEVELETLAEKTGCELPAKQ
jgi:thiol-disulfide isomerase/thioredoxin